jgi:hypothetical protein
MQKLADSLSAQQSGNRKNMALQAGMFGLCIAAGAVTSGLASTFALAFGFLSALELLRTAGIARGVAAAKAEASSNGQLPRTKEHGAWHRKAADRANKVTLGAMGIFVAAGAAALIAPAVLPAAMFVMKAALVVSVLSFGVERWSDGQASAATSALKAAGASVTAAPAAAPSVGAIAKLHSLLPSFKHGTTKETKVEAPKQVSTVVATPEVRKP